MPMNRFGAFCVFSVVFQVTKLFQMILSKYTNVSRNDQETFRSCLTKAMIQNIRVLKYGANLVAGKLVQCFVKLIDSGESNYFYVFYDEESIDQFWFKFERYVFSYSKHLTVLISTSSSYRRSNMRMFGQKITPPHHFVLTCFNLISIYRKEKRSSVVILNCRSAA